MKGKVYFVSAPGRIKIGYTMQPDQRLKHLRSMDMEQLEMIAVKDGTRRIEHALHALVADHRIRGEWFKDCPEVRLVIGDFLSDKLVFDEFGKDPKALPAHRNDGLAIVNDAIKESFALAEEIMRRAHRKEDISDLVRSAHFLAEKVIAPALRDSK